MNNSNFLFVLGIFIWSTIPILGFRINSPIYRLCMIRHFMYWEFLINKPVPRTQWVSTTQAGVQVETSHNQRALVWLQVKTNSRLLSTDYRQKLTLIYWSVYSWSRWSIEHWLYPVSFLSEKEQRVKGMVWITGLLKIGLGLIDK